MYIFLDEEHSDHKYVQNKPIIERPTPKRNSRIKSSTTIGDQSQELNDIQIDEKIATSSELNGEGIIAEQKVTIKSMESEIENLKKKYEEAIEKLNEKEDQIENLKKKHELNGGEKVTIIKSMQSEIENLNKKNEEAIEELNKKENQIENLEQKYKEAVKKGNKSSLKLEKIETMFFGPIDANVNYLSKDEKQTLERCWEFIKQNSTIRSNLTTRIKAINMKIKSMKSIEANAQELYLKCK